MVFYVKGSGIFYVFIYNLNHRFIFSGIFVSFSLNLFIIPFETEQRIRKRGHRNFIIIMKNQLKFRTFMSENDKPSHNNLIYGFKPFSLLNSSNSHSLFLIRSKIMVLVINTDLYCNSSRKLIILYSLSSLRKSLDWSLSISESPSSLILFCAESKS